MQLQSLQLLLKVKKWNGETAKWDDHLRWPSVASFLFFFHSMAGQSVRSSIDATLCSRPNLALKKRSLLTNQIKPKQDDRAHLSFFLSFFLSLGEFAAAAAAAASQLEKCETKIFVCYLNAPSPFFFNVNYRIDGEIPTQKLRVIHEIQLQSNWTPIIESEWVENATFSNIFKGFSKVFKIF